MNKLILAGTVVAAACQASGISDGEGGAVSSLFDRTGVDEVEAALVDLLSSSSFAGMYGAKSCTVDADCGDAYKICHESTCKHKRIFPIKGLEIAGTIVLTILMALAVMSGIGGGGIIVPLLMVFYKLSTKEAIAVSGFTILTGSVCRYILTLNQRHPDKDAPCIEYGLSNVMLPTVLVGSITGVFFNMLLPDIILQVCLTLLLAYLSIQSGFKARAIYRKETAEQAKRQQAEQPAEAEVLARLSDRTDGAEEARRGTGASGHENGLPRVSERVPGSAPGNVINPSADPSSKGSVSVAPLGSPGDQSQETLLNIRKVQRIEELERGHRQWKKQGINFMIFLALCFLNLFRGSKKNPSLFGVKVCSWQDWTSLGVYVVLCVLLSVWSLKTVQKEQDLK